MNLILIKGVKTMKEYTINLQLLNEVSPAVDKDKWNLCGIYINDVDGFRNYTACNGHILLTARESITGDTLENPLFIKMQKAVKTKFKDVTLKIVDDKTALIYAENKLVFDILDNNFPDYERVIPAHDTPLCEHFAIFDPDYMKIINNFNGANNRIPLMENKGTPALYITERDNLKKRAVIMPIRY
jgi:hypothetical protein